MERTQHSRSSVNDIKNSSIGNYVAGDATNVTQATGASPGTGRRPSGIVAIVVAIATGIIALVSNANGAWELITKIAKIFGISI